MNSASKQWFRWGLCLLLVAAVAMAGGGFWLLRTTAGLRWALETASRSLEVSIQAKRVEGTLGDQLILGGIEIDWAEGGLRIEELEFSWQPSDLLEGKLLVERLALSQLTLEIPGSKVSKTSAVAAAEPESAAPALPAWLSAEIGELEVTEFAVTRETEKLFTFSRLTASLELENQVIQVSAFSWNSPYVELAGDFRADLPDLDHLQLKMQTTVGLPKELVDHELLASIQFPTNAVGELEAEARFWSGFDYQGPVYLVRRDGQPLLAAEVVGTIDDLKLDSLAGSWLGGELNGNLLLDWSGDYWMSGQLRGRRLDPAGLAADWPGSINLDFAGRLEVPSKTPLRISGKGLLHPSTLRERSLAGSFDGSWAVDDLQLNALELAGEEGQLSARGRLAERLDFQLNLDSLAAWLPASEGQLKADGWLRWHGNYLIGALQGEGTDLLWQEVKIARLTFQGQHQAKGAPLALELRASDLSRRDLAADRAALTLNGDLEQHRGALEIFSQTSSLLAELSGSRSTEGWRGRLESLAGQDANLGAWSLEKPVEVALTKQRWTLSQLVLRSELGSKIQLRGEYTQARKQGTVEARWREVNLSRLQPWLPKIGITGKTSGQFEMALEEDRLSVLTGRLEGKGRLEKETSTLNLPGIQVDLNWDSSGLTANGSVEAAQGGSLQAELVSDQPAGWEVPGNGELTLALQDLDLALLRPWLPEELTLKGRIAGRALGRWTPELKFTLTGEAKAVDSLLEWKENGGKLRSEVKQLGVDWNWAEDQLGGSLKLALADFGQLTGNWSLPLPAQLPVAFQPQGPVQGRISGQMDEQGLLTAIYPALIQESQGQLELDFEAGGSWEQPQLKGTLALTEAGGFLPAAGIRLENLSLSAQLAGEQLQISSFEVQSGPGRLQGSGVVNLEGWKLKGYQATLKGSQFQLYNYPELQILSDPELKFEGTPERLEVRGRILLPELLVTGTRMAAEVRSSPDVEVIVTEAEKVRQLPLALDVEVQLVLGEQAWVRTSGFEAELGGETILQIDPFGRVTATGEIRVEEGHFAAYGAELKIRRGILRFRGGPAANPKLDILAVREIARVAAGVRITGTAEAPVVNLYSRPAMPEKDILGYIFMGRPIKNETDMLALGAGTLIPTGAGTLKGLGISEVDLQGLFSGDGGVRLRHRLAERWELESTLGNQSGIDLFYIIEFR